MAEFSFSNNTISEAQLTALHELMSAESTLLGVSMEDLQATIQANRAIIAWDQETGEPVGFIRFTPLLTPELKIHLGLTDFPDIWEIGTAYVHHDYRGNGLYADMRHALLNQQLDRMLAGELLVLGTSKQPAVLRVLEKAQQIGLYFHACHHWDFPWVAAFTCVCNPEFGSGFHHGEECPARVPAGTIVAGDTAQVQVENGKIPCVMYVSSQPMAVTLNNDIAEMFGGDPRNLVAALTEVGYYGT